ncbi:MAG: hypothetical protein ABJH68_08435 [Ilumatobacter sp.]|uniref:hypothetical protein n=1 Tax=Ilumatobacter sp. TaxID=1967498 RepID=UPI003297CDD2
MAWDLFERVGDGGFQICGIDSDARAEAPVVGLPIGCEVTVESASASPDALATTERDLEAVTASLKGRIVATRRTRTTLTTLSYLPSDDGADRYAAIALTRGASVSVAPAVDPDWTLFASACPSGMEEQSLLDHRVRNGLHAAGDTGGVRAIGHLVSGLSTDRVGSLVAAVESLGVTVTQVDGGRVEIAHEADPTDVTETSWTIRLISERFGGVYDGWGCAVLRDETSRPKIPARSKPSDDHTSRPTAAGRVRRWFRRT